MPSAAGAISIATGGSLYFGDELGFCSLMPDIYSVVLVAVPIWILIFVACYFVIGIRKTIQEYGLRDENREYKKILIYPFILMVCWFPELIDRLVYLIDDRPIFPLLLMHIIMTRLQGFFNALAYGMDKVKSAIWEKKIRYRDASASITSSLLITEYGGRDSVQMSEEYEDLTKALAEK